MNNLCKCLLKVRWRKVEDKMEGLKLFDKYDISQVNVADPAMKPYVILKQKLLLKSYGRALDKVSGSQMNILERMSARLAVPGHLGRKHRIITNWSSGHYNKNMKTVLKAMEIIERKTSKNPVQVLVDAIEKGSPRDEITVIESGGARYPQAVDCSPRRRVSLAIRWIVQGSYNRCFGKKTKMADSLANEIILASKESMESFSYSKKNESEKQADGAR
jgi:small subunit ribosomal protein S7